VTQGSRGARAFHISGFDVHCAPPAVHVVDTIGAGDAFSSGLLAYLARLGALSPAGLRSLGRGELSAALREAVAASAFTCTKAGADPPTAVEIASFLEGAGAGGRPLH
jgi:fructokinase